MKELLTFEQIKNQIQFALITDDAMTLAESECLLDGMKKDAERKVNLFNEQEIKAWAAFKMKTTLKYPSKHYTNFENELFDIFMKIQRNEGLYLKWNSDIEKFTLEMKL